MTYEARTPSDEPDAIAPDGLEVRLLMELEGASMASVTVPPHGVGKAAMHRTVDEMWHFISGEGEIWLADAERADVISARPGTSVSLPLGTRFQARNLGAQPLTAVVVTVPPWPGAHEAVVVEGAWPPTLEA